MNRLLFKLGIILLFLKINSPIPRANRLRLKKPTSFAGAHDSLFQYIHPGNGLKEPETKAGSHGLAVQHMSLNLNHEVFSVSWSAGKSVSLASASSRNLNLRETEGKSRYCVKFR